jgi:transposase InsO family protein
MLCVIDEYTRRCLAILVARRLRSDDVLQCLTDLFVEHGPPEHIRSDNGPEFAAKAVRHWLGRLGVKTLFIEPGSPWENGYCESFNSKLRDELLKAEVLIESWRRHWDYQEFCAGGRLSHPAEPVAEGDGELRFRLEPFTRRPFPVGHRMIENEV